MCNGNFMTFFLFHIGFAILYEREFSFYVLEFFKSDFVRFQLRHYFMISDFDPQSKNIVQKIIFFVIGHDCTIPNVNILQTINVKMQ